jgi:photosystem II stability/assembly factor-like uncharacterized protein
MLTLFSTSYTAIGQWSLQSTIGWPVNVAPIKIFPVDTNIVWMTAIDVSGGTTNLFARTTNGGATWTQGLITGSEGLDDGSIAALDSQTAWATLRHPTRSAPGGVFKTTDGGATWSKQTSAYPGDGGGPFFIFFWDADTGIVVGDRNLTSWEIYTTTDGGSTWTQVPQANIPPMITGEQLVEAFEFTVLRNTFWYCASAGQVYKSIDRGHTWTVVAIGSGYGRVHSIAFQDDSVGLACVFVGGNPTTVKTTNGGKTWLSLLPPSRPTPHIICHVPGTAGVYVVTGHTYPGTLTGSAFTLNSGTSWTTVDDRTYGPVEFIAPGFGWVGSLTNANVGTMYKWSGTSLVTSVNVGSKELPRVFGLEQNFPNPFNPSTTISYAIPSRSTVRLSVFNTLGQKVVELVNAEKEPGVYDVTFDAAGFTSGVYLYRIEAGGFVQTKKLVVLK